MANRFTNWVARFLAALFIDASPEQVAYWIKSVLWTIALLVLTGFIALLGQLVFAFTNATSFADVASKLSLFEATKVVITAALPVFLATLVEIKQRIKPEKGSE